ncbi:MAG: Asp-tRNA(Asn)/Glu-tRNA(Gln) amidotransferase subunit GatC [Candidatus Omnitrophica bacterium]|nr:Asp-tRNA(Asn)/Glu-tRNA(Gln) amidotransferase subunit GatC [Candidatus Omnitrophota bacterium]
MQVDIVKVAQLARIKLKDAEKVKLQKDLNSILDYVAQLNELDTKNVEPTSHVLNLENVYRKDDVKNWPIRDEVLKYAPLTADGKYFKVPKVIEGE